MLPLSSVYFCCFGCWSNNRNTAVGPTFALYWTTTAFFCCGMLFWRFCSSLLLRSFAHRFCWHLPDGYTWQYKAVSQKLPPDIWSSEAEAQRQIEAQHERLQMLTDFRRASQGPTVNRASQVGSESEMRRNYLSRMTG